MRISDLEFRRVRFRSTRDRPIGSAPALRTIIYRMLSAEPLERLAPAIVAIDLRMADIQCVGFYQDLLQVALPITSSYRCGYCPPGISTINLSESGVRLTWHDSRELARASMATGRAYVGHPVTNAHPL